MPFIFIFCVSSRRCRHKQLMGQYNAHITLRNRSQRSTVLRETALYIVGTAVISGRIYATPELVIFEPHTNDDIVIKEGLLKYQVLYFAVLLLLISVLDPSSSV